MSRSKHRAAQLSLFVSSFALGLCHFRVAAEETPGLTLAAARQQALAHSWDLLAAKSDVDRATAQSILAREIQNPTLSSTVSEVDQHYAVKSPIAGVVVDRALNPGLFVRTDGPTPLFTLSDPRHLWVYLDVNEKDVAHVRPGMVFKLTSAAYPGRAFTGKVDVVGDTLDPATRTVKVRGSVANPDRQLKAEMYVDVELRTRRRSRASRCRRRRSSPPASGASSSSRRGRGASGASR